MNTIILPIHKVRVDRGRSQISTEAADHEIAVLKAVHGDVTALLSSGVLDRTQSGRVIFPYDAVHVDFTLTHAA